MGGVRPVSARKAVMRWVEKAVLEGPGVEVPVGVDEDEGETM